MKKTDFTICMPVYNGEKYLARALDSILMQETGFSHTIWIVDDCSTDSSLAICREYQKNHPDTIEILHLEQNSKAYVFARLLPEYVKSPYWMVFDCDDYWLNKNKIEKTLSFLEKRQHLAVYVNNFNFSDKGNFYPSSTGQKNFYFTFKQFPLPFIVHTTACVFRNYFNEAEKRKIRHKLETGFSQNYIGCIMDDTFRTLYALSKGDGFYDTSIDSVYEFDSGGIWTSLSDLDKGLFNARAFLYNADFFETKDFQQQLYTVGKQYLFWVKQFHDRLSEEQQKEFVLILKNMMSIEKGLIK